MVCLGSQQTQNEQTFNLGLRLTWKLRVSENNLQDVWCEPSWDTWSWACSSAMAELWPSHIAVSPRVELCEAQLEVFQSLWPSGRSPSSLCVPIFAFPFSVQRALFSSVVWMTENMNSGFTQPDWKSCVTLNSWRDCINCEVKKTERTRRLKDILQPCSCPSSHDKVTQRNDHHYLYGVGNII